MPSLGDMLGGTTTVPQQQPGANDPGFEERKKGWIQSLGEAMKDPATAGMLLQMGIAVGQPRVPGETGGAHYGNAVAEGMGYRNRINEQQKAVEEKKYQRGLTERKQTREDTRVGYEGERLGLRKDELQQQKEDSEATRKLKERELDIAAKKLKLGVGGKQPAAQVQVLKTVASALMNENPGMTPAQAMLAAQERQLKTTPEDLAILLTKQAMDERKAMIPYLSYGKTLPPFDANAEYQKNLNFLRQARGEKSGQSSPIRGEGTGASQADPISVTTPDEARKLPPGTWFRTPQGEVLQMPEKR